MIFLISCRGPSIKPKILCDISFQFDRCRCRCFDLMKLKTTDPMQCKIVSERKSWNLPLIECDEISGFNSKVIAKKILPKLKKIKRHYDDKKKQFRENLGNGIGVSRR